MFLVHLSGISVTEFHEIALNAQNKFPNLASAKPSFLLVADKEVSCIYIEKLQFQFFPSKLPHFLTNFIISQFNKFEFM